MDVRFIETYRNPFGLKSGNRLFVGQIGSSSDGYCVFTDTDYCIRAFILSIDFIDVDLSVENVIKYLYYGEENLDGFVSFVCTCMFVHKGFVIATDCPLTLFKFVRAVADFKSSFFLSEIGFEKGYALYLKVKSDLFYR